MIYTFPFLDIIGGFSEMSKLIEYLFKIPIIF